MKKLGLLLMALMMSISLSACSIFETTEIVSQDNVVTLEAHDMIGSGTGSIDLEENQALKVNYNITSGYVRIRIIADEQNDTIFDQKNISGKDSFTVQGEAGSYSVVFEGKDANGTVTIKVKSA